MVKEGYEVPFGYEEAIGFMFGSDIRGTSQVPAGYTYTYMLTIIQKTRMESQLRSVQTQNIFLRARLDRRLKVMFAQLAVNLHRQGRTVVSYLKDLYER